MLVFISKNSFRPFSRISRKCIKANRRAVLWRENDEKGLIGSKKSCGRGTSSKIHLKIHFWAQKTPKIVKIGILFYEWFGLKWAIFGFIWPLKYPNSLNWAHYLLAAFIKVALGPRKSKKRLINDKSSQSLRYLAWWRKSRDMCAHGRAWSRDRAVCVRTRVGAQNSVAV